MVWYLAFAERTFPDRGQITKDCAVYTDARMHMAAVAGAKGRAIIGMRQTLIAVLAVTVQVDLLPAVICHQPVCTGQQTDAEYVADQKGEHHAHAAKVVDAV